MLNLKPPKNPNYCAAVVELKHFAPLAGCDNVQAALIFGNQVIVGKDARPGDVGLFFPVECALSREFLGANNLYRKPEWGNVDPAKKGFFEEHGRVKCVKFRGHASMGFFIPLASLAYLGIDLGAFEPGMEFDELGGREICRKYVPKLSRTPGAPGSGKERAQKARAQDRILAKQFEYHIDTAKLDRNIHKLTPDTFVSITDKWHGTSAIFAHLLVERPLKWYEKILARLGCKIEKSCYDYIWASRRVIKGVGEQPREGVQHYYKSDIWGTVFQEVKDLIPKGWTIYGEIVGYTPDGSPIQGGYHYGCSAGQHRFLVYRVSITNPDGKRVELTNAQIRAWCNSVGLEHVALDWEGTASQLFHKIEPYTLIASSEEAQQAVLQSIKTRWVNDKLCIYNNQEVPAEGVVVRFETGPFEFEAYKCKNTRFLEFETKQLDTGTVDMETVESEETNEN